MEVGKEDPLILNNFYYLSNILINLSHYRTGKNTRVGFLATTVQVGLVVQSAERVHPHTALGTWWVPSLAPQMLWNRCLSILVHPKRLESVLLVNFN